MNNLKIHPTYKNYGYNIESNEVVHIPTNKCVQQKPDYSGYSHLSIRHEETRKGIMMHRFVWECCNDIIPKGYEIDHMDKNKLNNRSINLRCITMQDNRKYRDHTRIIEIARNENSLKRFIKAIDIDTGYSCCFSSKSKCGKYFGISPAMVYLVCENKNRAKTANTNNGKYKFEYIDKKRC